MKQRKRASKAIRHRLCGLLLVLPFLLPGCASVEMKGTPFYTGEYSGRRGPAEDRANFWPFFCYSGSDWSIAWPLCEKTDDYFALRPLMSVYGLDQNERIWSFLWPLTQFDYQSHNHRFFPFFWGKDYFCGFPLYWHLGHPMGPGGGMDALLPAWWYDGDSRGYDAWIAGPLIRMKNRDRETGWHVFPLAGNYTEDSDYYRFLAWPLFHQWSKRGGVERGSAFLPLYVASRDAAGSQFLSLPYSNGRNAAGDERWDLLLPIYFASHDKAGSRFISPLYSQGANAAGDDTYSLLLPFYFNRRQNDSRTVVTPVGGYRAERDGSSWWFAVPALSGGQSTPTSGDTWILGPVAHYGWDGTDTRSHVAPLYYRSRHGDDSLFVSLPWSARENPEDSWWLVPPFCYHTRTKAAEATITPLYSRGGSLDGKSHWETVVPLYYRRQDADDRLVATLLGGWRTDEDGRRWLIYPLLSWGSHKGETNDFWAVAPLFHSRSERGTVTQQHLLPLYYRSREPDLFLSPLVGQWKNDRGGTTTLVPPLLSYYLSSPTLDDFWTLGGLAHFSGGPEAESEHVLPLYYRNRKTGTFLSAPYMRWGDERSGTAVIPLALSWKTHSPDRSDLWIAGPIAHFSWGENGDTDHILPLYYRSRKEDTFISPFFARWKSGAEQTALCPPLLSWYSKEAGRRDLTLLLGLAHERWGENVTRAGHFIPLYYHDGTKELYTPLFGWDREPRDGFFYPLTPLLGFWTGDHSGGWLFPLFSQRRDRQTQDYGGNVLWAIYEKNGNRAHSWMFPLYWYDNQGPLEDTLTPNARPGGYGRSFWCLPICWYDNQASVRRNAAPDVAKDSRTGVLTSAANDVTVQYTRDNGCFPLWSYASATTAGSPRRETSASVLLLLYDYKRTVQAEPPTEARPSDYTRARVLWHFWHYERSDDDVSVDMFPAITYDRKGDTFKKVTFLWRVFRYERDKDSHKLNLMFVPIMW